MNERLEHEIRLKNREVTHLNDKIAQKEKKFQNLQRTSELLDQKIVDKRVNLQNTQHKLDVMNIQLQALHEKGISPTLISRIYSMETESGEDLLERVTTSQTYTTTRRTLEEATKNLVYKRDEFNKVGKTLTRYRSNITLTKNELDQARKETMTFRKAVEVTEAFLEDGYSIPTLKHLRAGLNGIALKGKSQQSVNRLILGLQNVKSLRKLDDIIEEREKTLQMLNSNINQTKGELDTYQQIVLKTLNDAKKQALSELNDLRIVAVLSTTKIRDVVEKEMKAFDFLRMSQLKNINQKIMDSLNNSKKIANSITEYLDDEVNRVSAKLRENITTTTHQWQEDMDKWNTLKDKIREQEILGKYSVHLLSFLKSSPIEIITIPIEIIAQLMERIYWYTHLKFPDVLAQPSNRVSQLSTTPSLGGDLLTMSEYKLSALALFLKEEYEKRVMEEAQK